MSSCFAVSDGACRRDNQFGLDHGGTIFGQMPLTFFDWKRATSGGESVQEMVMVTSVPTTVFQLTPSSRAYC